MRLARAVLKLLLVVLALNSYCEAQCPRRNDAEAVAVGRPCQATCNPSEADSCNSRTNCVCDNECGYSCIATGTTCPPPPNIPNMARARVYRRSSNGSLVLVSSLPYRYNDVTEYECRSGYRKTWPIVNHFCHAGRGWTGSTTCVEACRNYNAHLARRENQICTRSCDTDSECPSNYQCLCDGYCGKSCVNPGDDCGPSAISANSAIVYSGEGFGRVARYTCDEGYYRNYGDSTRKCTGSGRWNRLLISCQRIQCGDPYYSVRDSGGRIADSQRAINYYIRSTIEIECRPHHVLVGPRIRSCLPNGQWNGSHTTCDPTDNEVRCKHPGIPVNGRLVGRNFSIGAVVEFDCNSGYVMLGDVMQECLYFLQWSGNGAPKCVDPLHPLNTRELFNKLQQANDEVQGVVQELTPGFSASSEATTFTNLYLILDLADDVGDDILEHSIAFAEDRVVTVSRGEIISCTIVVFASTVKVLLPLKIYSVPVVIENLENILVDKDEIVQEVGWRRNTEAALEHLNTELASSITEEPEKENIVFLLINGKANHGRSPTIVADQIRESFDENLPKVFVVSYGGGFGFGFAFEELRSLAIPQDLFLPNPNLDLLTEYSDSPQVTEECGRAGNIEGVIRQAAHVGNVAGGKRANAGAWPWHAIVSLRLLGVVQTFRNLRGGASLLNRKWVVTAAHLFDGITKQGDWQRSFMIIFGIHRIPQHMNEALPAYSQAFDSESVIIHSNFSIDSFDYDIALIELGRPYRQLGYEWQQISDVVPLNYSPYVRPVCLPCSSSCVRRHLTDEEIFAGNENEEEKCRIEKEWLLERNGGSAMNSLTVVTGFGSPDAIGVFDSAQVSQDLKQGPIRLQRDTECLQAINTIRPEGLPNGIRYTPRMVCGIGGQAGSTDACRGDSGGAFVREISRQGDEESCWVQIGLVSWGWGCAQTDRRGNPIPGFYTNLVSLIDWVIPIIIPGFTNNNPDECRRDVILLEDGRSCRKSCQFDSDCSGIQKRCICDDVCGQSCLNPIALCEEFPPLDHGTIAGGRTYGMVITYSCDDGYDLMGAPTRKCRSDRKWSGSAPICESARVSCALPSTLDHGSIISVTGDFYVDAVLRYECDAGYNIQGQNSNEISVTCLSSGLWSAPTPVCTEQPTSVFCAVPQQLESVKTQVPSGGNITYTCRGEFSFIGHSSEKLTAVCQSNGLWSQSMPICRGFGCTTDRITCSFPFIYRGHYHYSCTNTDLGRLWCSNTPAVRTHYGDCSTCSVRPEFNIYDPTNPNPYDQCNQTLQATEISSTITLPNHPSSYANNLDCYWIIRTVSSESQVELTVTSFVSERCCDYLKISDGSTILAGKSNLFRGRFLSRYRVVSTFGVLYVLFHSDDSVSYDSGLEMTYRKYNYVNCGGNLIASTTPKTISSPGWPNNYTHNAYCKWIISAPVGYQVKLDIPQSDTQHCCDEVSVRDGVDENSETFISVKGSLTLTQSLYSTNNRLLVLFHSDHAINAQGFNGTYVATLDTTVSLPSEVTVCNDQQLQAPATGYGNFSLRPVLSTGDDPFHCQWLILAPVGEQVRIWFSYYSLTNIVLLIRDGSQANANKIGSVEGEINGFRSFVSTQGALRVEAIAFPEKIQDTFYGFYEEHRPGRDSEGTSCASSQHTARSSLQYIATPDWPDYYPADASCTWTITARPGHYVRLHFLGVATEKNSDYLKIFDVTRSDPLLDLTGSYNQRFTVFSVGRSIRVEFTSDSGGKKYSGFRAAYEESNELPQYFVLLDRWNY